MSCVLDSTNFSIHSSGSSGRVRGGARNMKSMHPPLAAIFFMTFFYRAGRPWSPRHPPGSATDPPLNLDISTTMDDPPLWNRLPCSPTENFNLNFDNFRQQSDKNCLQIKEGFFERRTDRRRCEYNLFTVIRNHSHRL